MKMGVRIGFTLIELLIVVAIIGILAAIAIPNFLNAQTRAKVARFRADSRALRTGLETFRVDWDAYPVGTDNPAGVSTRIHNHFEQFGPYRFYTFRTLFDPGSAETLGLPNASGSCGQIPCLTTPIAYITKVPNDPFTSDPGFITYSYREDRARPLDGWIVTSFGPDMDESQNSTGGQGGALCGCPAEANLNGRNGDISERHAHPGADLNPVSYAGMTEQLRLLAYDPTNGTISEGDLWIIGP